MGRVGIIGVGNMGGGIAAHLLDQGWQVQVHDIDAVKVAFFEEKGAAARTSTASAATEVVALIV